MESMKLELRKYELPDGSCPFDEWRLRLAKVFQVRIVQGLAKIEKGNFANCRTIVGGEGVCEIRFGFGPGFRIYYGMDGSTVVLLLCGGDKSSQRRDIEKAKGYWREYRS